MSIVLLVVDAVLLIALSVLLGQRASIQPEASTFVFFGILWLLRYNCTRRVLTLMVIFAVGAWWRANSTLEHFDQRLTEARDWLGPPARCTAQVQVQSSPVYKGDAFRWLGTVEQLDCEGRVWDRGGTVRLYGGPSDLARGDRIEAVVSIAPTQLFHNLDPSDPRPFAARTGALWSGSVLDTTTLTQGRTLGAWIDQARAHVRSRILATYPQDAAPLGRALVLGEEDLAPEEGDAFRRSGLSHLLAVSGTHLVLVVVGLVVIFRTILLNFTSLAARGLVGPISTIVGIPLAILYADFAGGSGSAWRAAVMLGVLFGAQALGRSGDTPRALGLSLLLLAINDPLVAFDLSLLLSGAATAGLIWLAPPLRTRMPRCLPGWLAEPLATTLAATIACTPLLLSLSPEIPLAGLIANLLAVPVGELAALPICIFHTILPGAAERGAAVLGAGALLVVRWIAYQAAAIPGLPLPPLTELHGVVLILGGARIMMEKNRRQALLVLTAILLLVEGAAIRAGAPRSQLRVTALDVGQGDSLLVDFPDGQAMLIDGGGFVGSPVDPGRSVILPTLRIRRRNKLAAVVLSHPHPDHFLGLVSVIPSIQIGEFWDSGQGEEEGAGPIYSEMMKGIHDRRIPIRRPSNLCGHPQMFGEARVELLAPCPSITPYINANNNSMVLRISHGERTALLVGDAEEAEEHQLLALYGNNLHADLLKIGHHGSRTSTQPEFLAAVSPSLAVISCGVRNRFGHPHPTTMATLATAKIQVARTDRGGALLWSTDGRRINTKRAR